MIYYFPVKNGKFGWVYKRIKSYNNYNVRSLRWSQNNR